jgi:4-hydroxy-tetrahydrodipicolinate synthase
MLPGRVEGVWIVAATPFCDDGALDLASADRLVEFYLERGVAGIVLLGMMGEAPKLTRDEATAFVSRVARRVGGRVPLVAGVPNTGFAPMAESPRTMRDLGVAAVMIAPPAGLRGDESVLAWFERAAEAVGEATPFVLQDFPLANGVHMSAAPIRRIADTCANLAILEHEDWPGLDKISAIRAQEAAGARRLPVLVGNGGLFLPLELARGADCALTGYAFPEMLVAVCRWMEAGERERAMDLFDAHLPLLRYEQQPGLGLAVRKYVLAKRGAIASPTVRPPAPRLTPETVAEIGLLLERLEGRLPRSICRRDEPRGPSQAQPTAAAGSACSRASRGASSIHPPPSSRSPS